MDRDATFAAVAADRRALAVTLAGLDDDQWATPSLCGEWDVRHVVAHLTSGWNVGAAGFAWLMLRHRGFHGANEALTARLAERPTEAIVADLRDHADERFTPPGFGPEMPLTDVLVHGLDALRPLGLERPVSPEAATCVLDFLVTPKARKVVQATGTDGLALSAPDLGWSHGDGPAVTGTADDLLLVLAGRPAGLDGLTGDGVADLRARLT